MAPDEIIVLADVFVGMLGRVEARMEGTFHHVTSRNGKGAGFHPWNELRDSLSEYYEQAGTPALPPNPKQLLVDDQL